MKVLQTVSNVPLTEAEVISGLKEALTTGFKRMPQKDLQKAGYYGDQLIKILLPDEANYC